MAYDYEHTGQGALILKNGSVVTEEEVVQASVAVEAGRIAAVLRDEEEADRWQAERPSAAVIDARHKFVMPGLIDIHCDAIEKEVQPRPNTLFPLEMALLEFERKLPVHGITTMYHSLSLGVGLSLRGDHLLTEMVELIHRYRQRRSMIRNLIHLRFEVSHHVGLPIVEQYVAERKIDYLSFMDHSPGQGQYRAPGSFERYVMKNQGVSIDEVGDIVGELMERRREIKWERLKQISKLARSNGIAVASHDDDTTERVQSNGEYGITISEFPINMETALYASQLGMQVCVGAPNVVRGVSHDKNMRALDAINAGAADILCSDYHPSSLLAAIFRLVEEGTADLPSAVKMATLHPARAMGEARNSGSIEPGKAADLIVVDTFHGWPWVTDTIVAGSPVYAAAVRG